MTWRATIFRLRRRLARLDSLPAQSRNRAKSRRILPRIWRSLGVPPERWQR